MDITVGKSWYNVSKDSTSSFEIGKEKGRRVLGTRSNIPVTHDAFGVEAYNPRPSRLGKIHVQRLEGLVSKVEHDEDKKGQDKEDQNEKNDGIEQVHSKITKDGHNWGRQFPMEVTIDESMKTQCTPKRSRWMDMFESRHRTATQPNVTTPTQKNPPARFFENAAQKLSPLKTFSSPTAGTNSASSSKSPPRKKTPSSDDSKLFRAFLSRGDEAVPLFISPTGTHQQFFQSSLNLPRPHRSHPNIRLSMGDTANLHRTFTNPMISGTHHSQHPSKTSSIAGRPMSTSRTSRSVIGRTSSSHSSNMSDGMRTSMDRSFDSCSQLTDHTRMTSISGSFSFQPVIPEDQQIILGSTMSPLHSSKSFDQACPEKLPQHKTFLNQGIAFAPTTSFAPVPAPVIMSNMVTSVPDLSHLVKKFRPTNMLLREQGMIPDNSRHDTNYEGDENHPDLLDLPDSINCCMWIINIPREVQHGEFMRLLNCGAVAALSMVPPQNGHLTQAAKATFKKVSGGAELYRRARHRGGLRIRSHKIKVWYNDYGAYEWKGPETRFLEIEAPAVLDENFWQGYFNTWCKYTIISVTPLPCMKYGFASTRFEFVRIAGQAQTCFQAIQKDEAFLGQVKVQYGIDPDDLI
ncbi:5e158a30-de05-4394-9bb2-574ff2241b2e [Sclerotinia trifoliorum]|uniref:5e158a30-de05-4394-9bb2-574ff2241b2e n=1 Tax=Sclerotinia trifoliorum TaxID=28548 RepID=A0A8H2ZMS7_9HELO|nr:5e158a30-de05-4394-9bb2-574ff2241b2e [Sclerotinia trifoliorum]